ncbi:MAG: EF-P lysine aminoacylase GenX [Sandaracinaceae bacterium]|nr:EF-P lysine aminoacylase GenX [Sandaracinaceae bacterium]
MQGTRTAFFLGQRARVLRAIRSYFDACDFVEVDTPLMVPSPGLDVHLDAFEIKDTRAPRYLITSPEYQMKRLLAEGMPRIVQLCHCFRRNEEGSRHQPEFMMAEWYRTSAGIEEMMCDTEALVEHVARTLLGTAVIPAMGNAVDVGAPWERLTVRDAFMRYANVSLDDVLPSEEKFYELLVDKVEPMLGLGKPTLLYAYPASMASLARLTPNDPTTAERFEAYIDGVELCNGFGELTDPREQRARFEQDQAQRRKLSKPVYPIDEEFLSALDRGIPASGGNALGVDRLVMLITGATSIEDVVSIPASRL